MKEKLKEWLTGLLGSSIMVLIVFGVVTVVALVSGNVMRLFGFHYDSVGQLLLYFLLGEVIGLPLDLISTALSRALYRMEKVDRRQGNLLYIPMDSLFTIAAFWLADRLMAGVSTTRLSLCVLGIEMAFLTLPIPKKEDRDRRG